MSATVTLKIVAGPLRGAEFVYRLPALCSVGRGPDCSLRLPNDDAHRTVSRHHCLLEIDPPGVRVSDQGSLNGTFVNGEPIGADHALADGDELRMGEVVFRVGVRVWEEDGERAPCEPVCEAVC
jgi:pSer/pThr/pTyr-binding forkhead associated (FHA) protein